MPELRKDPVIGRWVIIATERARRPDQFATAVEKEELAAGEKCPFCEGNESMTPPEIFAVRKAGTKPNERGWDVRVIPYKFPLLQTQGDLNRRGHGMYDIMDPIGTHEIVVETPRHVTEGTLDAAQLEKVLTVVTGRISEIEKNLGREAVKNMLPMQEGDVPVTYADVDDLITEVGFKPSTSVEDGVRNFVTWFREYFMPSGNPCR